MITLIYGPDGDDVNDFNHQEWINYVLQSDAAEWMEFVKWTEGTKED